MARLLLVEDHETLGFALKEYLQMKGYQVNWSQSAEGGAAYYEKHPVDLCILDVMLPDQDGFELARRIRRRSPEQPLIFLTARSLKADRLRGFGLGADDYLVKPVDEEELVARIEAILRRVKPMPKTSTYTIGRYHFDPQNQWLSLDGDRRQLTEREAHLLTLLCEREGQLLSREQVLKELWNQNDYFTRRSMDVFISRLRKYLSKDRGVEIQNVYGSGFILKVK
ncbi:MAG TPA: response regulator transcription factor [Phaeodactylibacter sp.]|nr:response regulator transcription factor [Phaeodactylibacter sp.]